MKLIELTLMNDAPVWVNIEYISNIQPLHVSLDKETKIIMINNFILVKEGVKEVLDKIKIETNGNSKM